jgi:pimeloyl-ACP methyl ester carboxylesterase
MGGIYARMFYHQNPSLVKGLVLVDATHERQMRLPLNDCAGRYERPDTQEMEADFRFTGGFAPGSVKEEFRSNYKENYTDKTIRTYFNSSRFMLSQAQKWKKMATLCN